MKDDPFRQLISLQLVHRIWQSDLDIALREVNFWEDLLTSLDNDLAPNETTHDNTWQKELSQLHHFRRLIRRLQEDLQTLDQHVAASVRIGHVPDEDMRSNHDYLRAEMDRFHADFRAFKTEIRQYLTSQHTF
ncbi:hypothetical protein [Spirosoma koreense]